MKKINQLAIVILLSCTLFAACKKETTAPPAPAVVKQTNTQLLTGKKWNCIALTVVPGYPDSAGGYTTDFYGLFTPCNKDDYSIYNADGSGRNDDGATKCTSSNPQFTAFQWKFIANETQLVFDNDTTEIYQILQLDDSHLKYKQVYEESGVTQTMTITYQKQ